MARETSSPWYLDGSTSGNQEEIKIIKATIYDKTGDWEFKGKNVLFDDEAEFGFRFYSPRGYAILTLAEDDQEMVYEVRSPACSANIDISHITEKISFAFGQFHLVGGLFAMTIFAAFWVFQDAPKSGVPRGLIWLFSCCRR